MFSSCSSLVTLDLSNFNTEKVTNMNKMFYGCMFLYHLCLGIVLQINQLMNLGVVFYRYLLVSFF